MQIKRIEETVYPYYVKSTHQQEEFITTLAVRTDNFSPDKLTKKACETLLIKIGEMIDAAKEG